MNSTMGDTRWCSSRSCSWANKYSVKIPLYILVVSKGNFDHINVFQLEVCNNETDNVLPFWRQAGEDVQKKEFDFNGRPSGQVSEKMACLASCNSNHQHKVNKLYLESSRVSWYITLIFGASTSLVWGKNMLIIQSLLWMANVSTPFNTAALTA